MSPDGQVDVGLLRAAAGNSRPTILIVAPRVSVFVMRGLLHVFSKAVVVRPPIPLSTWPRCGTSLARVRIGRAWLGRGRGALVLSGTTTMDRRRQPRLVTQPHHR